MQLTRQRNYVIFLFLILAISVTQISQVTCETYTFDGYEIQTRLVPDKTTIMLGEPIYVSFIVDNHSDQNLQVLVGGDFRNGLGRPESFTVTVQGENNRHVPQPDAGPGMGGTSGPVPIPAGGNYAFRLFLPNWATFQEVGSYTMVARRILNLGKHTSDLYDIRTKTIDVQTEASTKLRVVPLDEAKMGYIINHLGSAMFSEYSYESEEATDALDHIQDERVIPYFVRASETNYYGLKFSALHALSKFDSESAFMALQHGLETEGEDNNIYLAAAGALARSPHPGAIPYLLSKRQHPYEGVRMTILHVVGKMKPEEAIPILQEMAHDESERVSTEAKRYLELLSKKNSASQH
jgi:hypothetical protein